METLRSISTAFTEEKSSAGGITSGPYMNRFTLVFEKDEFGRKVYILYIYNLSRLNSGQHGLSSLAQHITNLQKPHANACCVSP